MCDQGQGASASEERHMCKRWDTPPRPRQDRTALYHGGQTSTRVCLKALLCTADASTTEEPDAGKLHVRDCTGGAG